MLMVVKSKGLKFVEESVNTIRFSQPEDAVFPVVTAASLEKLIEHLVNVKYAGIK